MVGGILFVSMVHGMDLHCWRCGDGVFICLYVDYRRNALLVICESRRRESR